MQVGELYGAQSAIRFLLGTTFAEPLVLTHPIHRQLAWPSMRGLCVVFVLAV